MVFKRYFEEEGSDKSPNPDNSKSPPTKFQKVVRNVMKESSLQEIAAKISTILEPALRRAVKEEVEPLIAAIQASPRHSLIQKLDSFPSRGKQLHFINKLPSTIFTNSKVEDEDHAPLQIHLVDANSNNVIKNGPLSAIKVEIVVLSGDFGATEHENWTQSEFNRSIVREREGKRPLLVGDRFITLVNGVGCLGHISFTDNSSWIRSRKFKLGVQALPSASFGSGIREAVSKAFVVLDHRGESYQKHNTPSLDDPVWRLRKISKLGASHQKLESHGIKTVKDFLVQFHMNPSWLRRVLGNGVANRAWETMVGHANDCYLDNTYYSYFNEVESIQLLFNCVYKVIAVKFAGQEYQLVDSLDNREKALVEKLKQSAFSNPNELVSVQSTSTFFPSAPLAVEHIIPFSSPKLGLQHDSYSMIDQDEADKHLDFNLSDTASYPCTIESGYLLEDNSTSQTNQPVQGFTPDALMMDSSSAEPSDIGYNWYINSPITTFTQNNLFEEFAHLQSSLLNPVATTWGQQDGLQNISIPAAHLGSLPQFPDCGVNVSGTGAPTAGWCKIRAAVMWKIVRRNAAAKRKGKFPFGYYQCHTTTN